MRPLLAGIALLFAPGCSPAPGERPDLVYATTPQTELKLDLQLPAGGAGQASPVLIWIHGGGWAEGSRKNSPLQPLVAEGYAVVSVSYRFAWQAPFPAQIQDVKSAVRWLRAHAAEHNLDPNRIGVAGESAGGHLAALLGLSGDVGGWEVGDHREFSSQVQAVVALCAPTDLVRIDPGEPSVESLLASGDEAQTRRANLILSREATVSALLGAPASAHPDKARAASPRTYVSPASPPFLFIHGDRDQLVPLYQSIALRDALDAQGIPTELRIMAGAGHGFARFSPEMLAEVKSFFDRGLKGPGPAGSD